MVRNEQMIEQAQDDHGLVQARAESLRRPVHVSTVMWTQGYRIGWWDAVSWLWEKQQEWGVMSERQQARERRLGDESIFWPLIKLED